MVVSNFLLIIRQHFFFKFIIYLELKDNIKSNSRNSFLYSRSISKIQPLELLSSYIAELNLAESNT